MLETIVVVAIVLLALWAIAHFFLAGGDLTPYDHPIEAPVIGPEEVSAAHDETVAFIPASGITGVDRSRPAKERIRALRQVWEEVMPRYQVDATITPTTAADVPAEWVVAPGADPDRRLLYIHGGAFVVCSPRTHRGITTSLSARTGASVLAIDYRMQPEHRRSATIADCRSAYRWMLENGPEGPGTARHVLVAGDSAGGTLTLGLLAWSRDAQVRVPDAAAALSPSTDATGFSPSMRRNIATDPILGPAFSALVRIPRTLWLYFAWLSLRMRPCHPQISPAHGDLSGLPPLLIQASEAEILIDDARRYANKAASQGSPVLLQTWPKLVHVWHFFDQPETTDAIARIAEFIEEHAPRGAAAATPIARG